MNNLRVWVVLLALVSFGAGTAAGVWATASRLRPEPKVGPFEDYRRMLLATFSLSPERTQHLETVLAAYAHDLEDIQSRRMADTMNLYASELEERGQYYRSLIQDHVLPENQRQRFEELAQGLPTNTH
ncbi:MAG: hypothetical protein IPJ19_05350 [Planctomycetes bacterium]|nr:hypothetical protein [Planctomycetota bacterium]